MVNVKDYEEMFKKNGWDKYTCNLYEFIANGRDVNVLIRYLQEYSKETGDVRSGDINKLENVFRENGWWDEYSCNLYEWIAKQKDVNILIKYLAQSVGKIDPMTKNRPRSISCSKPEDF